MSLRKFSDTELTKELERREKIKNSTWPKKRTVTFNFDLDDHEAFLEFMEAECGFRYDSLECNRALESIENASCELSIYADGKIEFMPLKPEPVDDIA